MISRLPLIEAPDDYAALSARAFDAFDLKSAGLPEQVFRDRFRHFSFVEFDIMLSADFWQVLADCARACGDQAISVIVHDPHPETYYFANFGCYGAMRFDATSSSDEYKEAWLREPEGSPADALQYVATIVSWCGSSCQWGFWGERDLGVGVAGTRNPNMPWPSAKGVKWFDVDAALTNLIAPNYENGDVPHEFCVKLRNNFAASS